MALGTLLTESKDAAGAAETNLNDAKDSALGEEASAADMLAFQMQAALFNIVMSALSNAMKSTTDGMKQPADNARG